MTYPPQDPQQPQYALQQQHAPQQPRYQQPYPQVPPPLNSLAIIAFVGSFFVGLVGIICGHIAMGQTKRTGERGYGFALAGAIIGYAQIGIAVISVIFMLLFGSLFLGVLGIAAGSAVGSAADSSSPGWSDEWAEFGPQNMESGGAIFDETLSPISTPALTEGAQRVEPYAFGEEQSLSVTVYVDYMCPGCGRFEQTHGDMLEQWAQQGDSDITLQIYPVSFLDPMSAGTDYSTRAANLFGCTVELAPESAWSVHRALLSEDVQPEENTAGLTDDELIDLAENAGVLSDTSFTSCVTDRWFEDFFDDNTEVATQQGLLGLADGEEPTVLRSTPTVIVGGRHWDAQSDGDLEDFLVEQKKELEKAG